MHAKIKVKNPLVEIDGDEMARVMWKMVKETLIFPYLDLEVAYYDLHIMNRDRTDDRITTDAALAISKHAVGVKCATITPDEERVREYGLKKKWRSPNATIREILDGTIFRKPILVQNVRPAVKTWRKPIVIGRHASGDVYNNTEVRVSGPGKTEIVITPEGSGNEVRYTIHTFTEPGIIQAVYNTDNSIRNFARTCFAFALEEKIDLWFSCKDTISKTYDGRFREIFQEEYDHHWQEKLREANLSYFFTLIDDAAARIIKSEGGILWALKNYDGDVMSDMIASAYGSLAMMTSVLVSPRGLFEYEAAHGTVRRHYLTHQKGGETSTNPMATIFAWSGALKKRGALDNTPEVTLFAEKLEAAAIETVESGVLTADLIPVAEGNRENKKVTTEAFIHAIAERLREKLSR